MNRAFYGDIHGCIDELEELHRLVEKKYPGIEHWHVGDMWDRGPDSGRVTEFCYKRFAGGVMGNHESSVLSLYKQSLRTGKLHGNDDKRRTVESMNAQKYAEELWAYAEELPWLHVFDDTKLIIVHAGLYPSLPLHIQSANKAVCHLQMIKCDSNMLRNKVRWWGGDGKRQPRVKRTEAESRKDGYVRWYEVYDNEYACIYGHSVIGLEPHIIDNGIGGKTIGIDTGSCFGGNLTAFIYPAMDYIQVPCKEYVVGKNVRKFKGLVSTKGEFEGKIDD